MTTGALQGMTRLRLDRPFGNPGLDPELLRQILETPKPVNPEAYPKDTSYLNPFSRHAIGVAEGRRIAERLACLAEDGTLNGMVNAGSIEVIGLGGLKKAYEADWSRIREKVHLTMDGAFKAHLAKGDLAVLLDDEHFLVLFDGRPAEECRDAAEAIARDVSMRLAGEAGPEHMVAVLGRDIALELANLLPRLFKGRETAKEVAAAGRSALGRFLADEQAAVTAIHQDFSLSFLATLNSAKRAIVAYEAIATVPAEHVGRLSRGLGRASLDAFAVAGAARELKSKGSRGAPLLIVPVSYQTLASPILRPAVIEALRILDAELPSRGERRLLLRLGDFPDYLNYNQMLTVLGFASPWILGYLLSLRGVMLLKGAIQGLKVRAIVVEAQGWKSPVQGSYLGRTAEATLRLLDSHVGVVKGVRVLFSNVAEPEVIRILRQRYRGRKPQVLLNGPALAPAGRHLGSYCSVRR